MAIFGAALLALSAVQAISSVQQGYAEKEEAEYNAALLNEKAAVIDIQKKLEFLQYEKLKGRTWSSGMANIGAMGIAPGGSAMAVLLNTEKNITTDQIIGQFNIEQDKKYTQAESEAQLRAGKRAVKAGYSKGFTSILSGAASYAAYK